MVNRVFAPPAVVRTVDAEATEQELISTAKAAISACNWTVGECAVNWCRKYARGRTDSDFGQVIGLSGDQVYMRRRVWETFTDRQDDYPALRWSHFYVALTWSDADECLAWANENEATIAEMKAWRRMQNGEDLTVESDARVPDDKIGTGDTISGPRPEEVPEYSGTSDSIESVEGGTAGLSGSAPPMTVPDHDPAETPYQPFRKDAGGPPRDQTREGREKQARGRSEIALAKAFWRAARELINAHGTVHAQALLTEMMSDHRVSDEVEEVDEPRLQTLLRSINN